MNIFGVYRQLLGLLDKKEAIKLRLLFVLMLLTGLVDMAGVASIMPFMTVLASPEMVNTNPYLQQAYVFVGASSIDQFFLILGGFVFVVFVGSLVLKAVNAYAMLRFTSMRSHSLSCKLLQTYLAQPYPFFLQRNTSDLSKIMFSDVADVVSNMLFPLLRLVASSIVAVLILSLLLVVEPWVTLVSIAVMGGFFGFIFLATRKYLNESGKHFVANNSTRFILANEALSGIKELKLTGREADYLERFKQASFTHARLAATSKVLGDIPQYAIQILAFGGMLIFIMFLVSTRGSFNEVVPSMALFALAAYKALPAAQEIYKNFSQIRFYTAALTNLHKDLYLGGKLQSLKTKPDPRAPKLTGDISLRQVSFAYPGSDKQALNNVSLDILAGQTVAFVGPSGAGKSTLVDLILGLIRPSQGELQVGGQRLDDDTIRQWQRNIGYVPQSIYLADVTIAENIAFGLPKSEIDMQAVKRAAQMAHIDGFIESDLQQGYNTLVGERGVRLSGGQRQRIGIARALYHNPDVVVFDEATSALDNATEAAVMEAIAELQGHKTVILIAHRIHTVSHSDGIFVVDAGFLIKNTTYQEFQKSVV